MKNSYLMWLIGKKKKKKKEKYLDKNFFSQYWCVNLRFLVSDYVNASKPEVSSFRLPCKGDFRIKLNI